MPEIWSEERLQLRDNLGDILLIAREEEQNGGLETFSAAVVAVEAEMEWQPSNYTVGFTALGKELMLRRENRSFVREVFEVLSRLAANLDLAITQSLAEPVDFAYEMRVGDRRIIYTVHWPSRSIIVHLVGHWRELTKHQ